MLVASSLIPSSSPMSGCQCAAEVRHLCSLRLKSETPLSVLCCHWQSLAAILGGTLSSLRYSALNPLGSTSSILTGSLDDGGMDSEDAGDLQYVFPYSSTAHDAATKIQRTWRWYTNRKLRAATMLQVPCCGARASESSGDSALACF